MAEEKLREDFYYRINIIPIVIPPLRERKDDIPLLANHFIGKVAEREGKHVKGITREALEMMISYHWPGNVRELENIIERTVTLADQEAISAELLPSHIQNAGKTSVMKNQITNGEMTFPEAGDQFEKSIILDALKKTDYVQTKAATTLGISRRILKYKMDKLGILPKSN